MTKSNAHNAYLRPYLCTCCVVAVIFFDFIHNELESNKTGAQTEKWAIFNFFSLSKCKDLCIIRRAQTFNLKKQIINKKSSMVRDKKVSRNSTASAKKDFLATKKAVKLPGSFCVESVRGFFVTVHVVSYLSTHFWPIIW